MSYRGSARNEIELKLIRNFCRAYALGEYVRAAHPLRMLATLTKSKLNPEPINRGIHYGDFEAWHEWESVNLETIARGLNKVLDDYKRSKDYTPFGVSARKKEKKKKQIVKATKGEIKIG